MKLGRLLRFGQTIAAGRLGMLKRPFKLTFIVTKECHSRCLNCNIWQIKPRDELTIDEIRQLARNSPFLSWVHFAGGEPTDRDDFPDIASAFLENLPRLFLLNFPTNGLKPKRIETQVQQIARLRPPKFAVTVSIDGPQEINDRLRGIPGDFERAAETFRRIEAIRGVDVMIGMTLYGENSELLSETIAALKEAIPGFSDRKLHVNIAHTSAHYYGNSPDQVSRAPKTGEAIRELSRRRGFPASGVDLMERLYHNAADSYLATGRTPVDCAALYASCYLSETGQVFPCSIWDKPLGNIRDHGYSLEPIIGTDGSREARRLIREKNCPNCWTPCEAYQSLLVGPSAK